MVPEGGRLSDGDTLVTVENADAATIYISIATNFVDYKTLTANAQDKAEQYLGKASAKSFDTIIKSHVVAYQHYFNRVKLDLGTSEAIKLLHR